jgi:hypothetical protein
MEVIVVMEEEEMNQGRGGALCLERELPHHSKFEFYLHQI